MRTASLSRFFLALTAWCCLLGCVTVKVNLFEDPGPLEEKVVSGFGRDKVLLMDISGVIMESPQRLLAGFKGVTSPARIKEELEKAAQDRRVKAIVLRINSPGGTVSAADLVHHEIQVFKKEHGVPVVACLMGVATSGGYYAAMAADAIVAQPTCVTGSIGVLSLKLNLKGLMDKVGVEGEVVKTGEWKDFWSPFRPASEAEKKMMQQVINQFHAGFLEVVAKGRHLSRAEAQRLGDGRIFTASQALDLRMVDQIAYLDDAIKLAKTKAGLEEVRVVRYHRPGSHRPTIYSLGAELEEWILGPQFLYLWWPGETS